MPDDPEKLSDEDLLVQMKADNDRRQQELVARTNGAWLPVAVDQMRMLTYLRFICVDLGILVPAELEFEAWRTTHLDKGFALADTIEQRVKEQKTRAALGLSPPVPGGAPPVAGPRIVRPGET